MRATREFLYAAALCLFVGAIFSVHYGQNGIVDWRTPVRYDGDAIAFLAQVKVARDGWMVPVAATAVPDLNAPFEANWNDYPQTQKTFFWLAGVASRGLGLAATANLLLLAAHLLAALTFFGVARYLRADLRWAWAGAVVYASSTYIWLRGLAHLSLSFYWHVPLALLVAGWSFRRHGLRLRSRRFALAVCVAVVAALSNVYYAAMFVQLLGLAALAHAVRRTWTRMTAPLVLIGLTLGLFVLESAGTLLYPRWHGANPAALARPVVELTTYALRPLALLWPWHLDAPVDASGEQRMAYVGAAALCGLGLLMVPLLIGIVQRRRVWLIPALGAVVWILSFSIVGGVNALLGSFGIVLLRGTNRYCIWLAAIGLLYLAGRLSRLRRVPHAALVAVLVALALVDQVPPGPSAESQERTRRRFEGDRRFAAQLESDLPGGGMVFMLPVVDYPEVGPTHHMGDYQHFRPYLFTSHVRYSYGGDKGRPRERWQRDVEALPAAAMVDRLERYGFAGIVVDRRGYEDMGQAVLQELAAAGRAITIDDRSQARAFVALQPRGNERP